MAAASPVDPLYLDKQFMQLMGYRYIKSNEFETGAREQVTTLVQEPNLATGSDDCCSSSCPDTELGNKCLTLECPLRATKVECGVSCSDKCTNQMLRRGLLETNELQFSAVDGVGICVCSTKSILSGQHIIEYVGRVERGEINHMQPFAYPITRLPARTLQKFYVNCKEMGNESRLFLHNAEPNCIVEEWIVGSEVRLLVVSVCRIEKMQPLTINYPQMGLKLGLKKPSSSVTSRRFMGGHSLVKTNKKKQ